MLLRFPKLYRTCATPAEPHGAEHTATHNVHHTSAGVLCTGCSDDLLWTGPGDTEKGMGDDGQLGHPYLYRSSWY